MPARKGGRKLPGGRMSRSGIKAAAGRCILNHKVAGLTGGHTLNVVIHFYITQC